MNNGESIDVESRSNAGQAVAVRHPASEPASHATPAQAKVDAIAALTMKAYDRASQLSLSTDEVKALSADFPDDAFKPGAAGKENLIYIEHAYLRDRFNQVFGMGQWAIVPRNRWAEEFTTSRGDPGTRIYVEAMLLVRGCFVGEAVGSMEYYPKNASQDYGDAVEGAKTAAFRRCAKELGVGLQAWKKDWCEGWWQRRRGDRNSNTRGLNSYGASPNNTRVASEPPKSKAANTARTEADAKARTVSPAGGCATAMHRDRMIAVLIAWEDQRAILEYARKAAVLLPTETLPDWPLQYVPVDAAQMKLLQAAIKDFMDGGDAVKPFVNPLPEPEKAPKKNYNVGGPAPGLQPEPAAESEPWRSYVLPFGKDRSPLGQMSKKTLFGWWANFKCEPTYEKDGKVHTKSPASLAKDKEIRKMLDEAGRHYEFTTKEAA